MGSGLPVSGVIATEEISNTFHEKAFYFNTTAATPLQAAVAGTVIDIIQDEGLIENAEKIGGYLKTELLKIKDDFDYLGDVRGPGLFIGLDIVDNKEDKNPDREKAIEIVEILNSLSKNVSFLEIDTDKGHDSFLLDEPELDYVIKGFLDSNYGKINE